MTDNKSGCLFSLQINIQFGDLFLSPLLYSAMFQTLQTHCSLCFAIHKQWVASFGAGFLSLEQTGWLRVFLGTWWSATHKTQQQFKFSACWITHECCRIIFFYLAFLLAWLPYWTFDTDNKTPYAEHWNTYRLQQPSFVSFVYDPDFHSKHFKVKGNPYCNHNWYLHLVAVEDTLRL